MDGTLDTCQLCSTEVVIRFPNLKTRLLPAQVHPLRDNRKKQIINHIHHKREPSILHFVAFVLNIFKNKKHIPFDTTQLAMLHSLDISIQTDYVPHTQEEHAGRNLTVWKHEKHIQNSNSREKVTMSKEHFKHCEMCTQQLNQSSHLTCLPLDSSVTVKNFPNPHLSLALMQLLLPIGVQLKYPMLIKINEQTNDHIIREKLYIPTFTVPFFSHPSLYPLRELQDITSYEPNQRQMLEVH